MMCVTKIALAAVYFYSVKTIYMKTILAPVDFSEVSYNACSYAAKLAEDIKAELVLLHVMEVPVTVAEFPMSEAVFDGMHMQKELEALEKKLLNETHNNVKITSKNIMGSVEYEIKELCNNIKPLLVVMGTHSSDLLDRFFVGSTTLYSARHLRYPVVVVPPYTQYAPVKKIALASDLKDIYDVPVHEIEMIVKAFNAGLEIFYIGKDQKTINRNAVVSLMLNNRLTALEPELHLIEDEDVLKGVESLVKAHNIDLLIIIPKKHIAFHKSKSRDFIFYSRLPVMSIHENDVAEYAKIYG
jgi:nucleotide-binding universal stress UspA family protein